MGAHGRHKSYNVRSSRRPFEFVGELDWLAPDVVGQRRVNDALDDAGAQGTELSG